ncbi:MAG: sigma-70 family RNA polymerase sigma factor [Actinomycetota bacterium]|nr:sigma-70 family RNA polymerase sigma factor [Actinomycetota bacterium]
MDDTLQDTFVRAYRSRARFDPTRPPLPWLLTIARRACVESLRALPPENPGGVVDFGAARPDDDPYQRFESRLRRETMSRALADLSPRHRRLLLAWEVQFDRPYPELAEREGISTKALKSALCRARSAFRQRYTALAEKAGVAAFTPWSARLRTRLQRAWGWASNASLFTEAATGIAAALATTAIILVPPSAHGPAERHQLVAVASALPEGPQTSRRPLSAAVQTAGVADDGMTPSLGSERPAASRPQKPRVEATTPVGNVIAASSGTDLDLDPDAATATVTLGVDHPIGPLTFDTGVEVRCDTSARRGLCETARQTPLAR